VGVRRIRASVQGGLRVEFGFNTPYYTHREVYMRTNIVLDDELVREAFRHAPVKTKRELIDLALREFVASRKRRDMRDLIGKVKLDPHYDYKKARIG
jgi:Arc/MetJ family transcription regulator